MTATAVKHGFRDGARLPGGLDANAIARELDLLHRRDGKITPDAVIESAEREDSPMHRAFEWDDGEAGHQFRLMQARRLIRVIVVIPDTGPAEPTYVHVRYSKQDQGYQPLSTVLAQPDMYDLALGELLRKFNSAANAVEEVQRAAEQSGQTQRISFIRDVIERFDAVRESLNLLKAS